MADQCEKYLQEVPSSLLSQKKYKKCYTVLSKFFSRYDCFHQINPYDRAYYYNVLLSIMTKIFRKSMLKDLSKKNAIEVKVQFQRRIHYSQIVRSLIQKTALNMQYVQMDAKEKSPLNTEINREMFYYQGILGNRKQQTFKIPQQILFFDHLKEMRQFLLNTTICFRLISSLDSESFAVSLQYALSSYNIAKVV